MNNEQIIIDGVDVSECGFYHSEISDECHIALAFADQYTDADYTYLKCKQNPNCYYKQLKRKEQECEELKKQYNCYACDTCKGKEDYINLKRHCENAIKALHNKQAEVDRLKTEKEKLKYDLKTEQKDNQFIKKCCIEAGKELAKNSFAWDGKEKNLVIQAMELNERYNKLKQTLAEIKDIVCRLIIGGARQEILQKINKVEDENY